MLSVSFLLLQFVLFSKPCSDVVQCFSKHSQVDPMMKNLVAWKILCKAYGYILSMLLRLIPNSLALCAIQKVRKTILRFSQMGLETQIEYLGNIQNIESSKVVILSSAGLAGNFYAGALDQLWDTLHDNDDIMFLGSSAGAVVATVFLGSSTKKEFQTICLSFFNKVKRSGCIFDVIPNILQHFLMEYLDGMSQKTAFRLKTRLLIAYLNAKNGQYVIDSGFEDFNHLLSALVASCHTPFITGMMGPIEIPIRDIKGIDAALGAVYPLLLNQEHMVTPPILLTPFQINHWAENSRHNSKYWSIQIRGDAPYDAMTICSETQMIRLRCLGFARAEALMKPVSTWVTK